MQEPRDADTGGGAAREAVSDMEDGAALPQVGSRIREIRAWRDVTLRAVAELAGISPAYLSMIENGERPLGRRSTLEAIARALRVSPGELGALPTTGVQDPDVSRALDALVDVEAALTDVQLGECTVIPRPWEAVSADVQHLYTVLRPRSDIGGQMELLPGLVRELNALVATDPAHRREVVESLMLVLLAAGLATKYVGARGTPGLAAMHMRAAAEELEAPRWIGLATFTRAQTLGSGARQRSRELSLQAVDELRPHMADEPVRQLVGMLHLNAGLASAALNEADTATAHLQEARAIADSAPDPAGSGWANLSFCRTNVQFWHVALTLEAGDAGKVPELAEEIAPERVASWSRQGAFFADLGRALAANRGTRDDAVVALTRAEQLSPVSTRANVYVRETVRDLLVRVKRDAPVGRELRGMAYRMGLAA